MPDTHSTPAAIADQLAFLNAVGASETRHTNGPLRAHLEGVHATLRRWGCPDAVCVAGLFHSVYGTESFRHVTIPLAERANIRERIGADAERLVFLFASMRRASLYANLEAGSPYAITLMDETQQPLTDREFTALLAMTVANRLEQTRVIGGTLAKTYRRAIPLLPRGAVGEVLAKTRVGLFEDFKTLTKRVLGRTSWRTG